MPSLSRISLQRLETCHPLVRKLIEAVIKEIDIRVECGFRDREDQNKAYSAGRSGKLWPDSRHNSVPAEAVDITPYPKRWQAPEVEFGVMAGIVKMVAKQLGIKIRWGGDWDGDWDTEDQKLNDYAHFELVKQEAV